MRGCHHLRQEFIPRSGVESTRHPHFFMVYSTMMVIRLSPTFNPWIEFALIWRSWPRRLIETSCLRFIWGFICFVHKWFHSCVCLIKVFLSFFLTYAIFEAVYLIELTNSSTVELINARECLLPEGFLVIRKEKSSELLSLKKVFTMVLILWHSQNFSSIRGLVSFRCWVLCFHIYSIFVHLFWIVSVLIHLRWDNIVGQWRSCFVSDRILFLKNVCFFTCSAWHHRRSHTSRSFKRWLIIKSVVFHIIKVLNKAVVFMGEFWSTVPDLDSETSQMAQFLVVLLHCFVPDN